MEETKRRRFIIRAVLEGEVDIQDGSGGKSDMNGWTDGVVYTDLEIVNNSYVDSNNGLFRSYNGWSRTGYVPCDGCSSLTFNRGYERSGYGAFYDQDHNRVAGLTVANSEEPQNISVPATAYYFSFSMNTPEFLNTVEAGIIPNA